jgi:hypothetical protein
LPVSLLSSTVSSSIAGYAAAAALAAGLVGGWAASHYVRVVPMQLAAAQEAAATAKAVGDQATKVVEVERGHQQLASKYGALYEKYLRRPARAVAVGVPIVAGQGSAGPVPATGPDPGLPHGTAGDQLPARPGAGLIEDCKNVTARLLALQGLLCEAGQAPGCAPP